MGSNPAPCSNANSLIDKSDVNDFSACDSRSLATGSSELDCIVVRPSCGVCQRTTRKPCSVCHQRPQGIGGVLAPATLLSGSRAGESTLPVGTAPAAHE